MSTRDRKATEKHREYQQALSFKNLNDAWKSLKRASEDLRPLMAEKKSVKVRRLEYGQWLGFYEEFIQANDAHCLHLNDTAKRDHLDSWFQEKEI